MGQGSAPPTNFGALNIGITLSLGDMALEIVTRGKQYAAHFDGRKRASHNLYGALPANVEARRHFLDADQAAGDVFGE